MKEKFKKKKKRKERKKKNERKYFVIFFVIFFFPSCTTIFFYFTVFQEILFNSEFKMNAANNLKFIHNSLIACGIAHKAKIAGKMGVSLLLNCWISTFCCCCLRARNNFSGFVFSRMHKVSKDSSKHSKFLNCECSWVVSSRLVQLVFIHHLWPRPKTYLNLSF